jgi:predicted membrane-bound spermidine synthase
MEYIEQEGDLSRRYVLKGEIQQIQTDKTLLELVPTEAFGEMIFMDGVLQLARKDEYIYHEMLVHPAMTTQKFTEFKKICVLGGGDNCCVREIRRWTSPHHIDVYDWDEKVLDLFSRDVCSNWNTDGRTIHLHCQNVLDISGSNQYDLVFVDLVDPNYEDFESRSLWKNLIPTLPSLLKPNATLVINGGGIRPWDTKNADWILMLISSAFQDNQTHTLEVYKTFVPSFASDWCFFMIKPIQSRVQPDLLDRSPCRYMGTPAWILATTWTKDYEGRLPIRPVKLSGYLPPL